MKMPSPEDRLGILDASRRLKMARSAHAYVRGNTAQFYEWLAESPAVTAVPEGPPIWICGDCHLGNLGPLADGDGRVEVQIRDLDQAVIGNPAHDLIRLGLSLATAARGSDLSGVTIAQMVRCLVDGYLAALADPHGGETGPEPDAVRTVRRRALGRRWRHLARDRLDTGEPVIPLGRKFWPLDPAERDALNALFADPDVARHVLSLDHADADRSVRLVDAAYWMKGCSSLGLLRFAAIVSLDNASGRSDYALVDLKEAVASVAPAAAHLDMPGDPAIRVVTAARALSPHLGARMMAVRMLDRSLFIRELAPQDLKIEAEQFSEQEGTAAARYLAFVVGKAHGRQLDDPGRAAWRATLEEGLTGAADAPSWLWDNIVALAGSHEAGYLEHCRRYTMEG